MSNMRIESVDEAKLLPAQGKYLEIFTDTIKGRECKVAVTHYLHQPPLPHTWDCSDDYYGYTEFEVELLNNDGTYSELLNTLMTDADRERYLIQYELMRDTSDYLY